MHPAPTQNRLTTDTPTRGPPVSQWPAPTHHYHQPVSTGLPLDTTRHDTGATVATSSSGPSNPLLGLFIFSFPLALGNQFSWYCFYSCGLSGMSHIVVTIIQCAALSDRPVSKALRFCFFHGLLSHFFLALNSPSSLNYRFIHSSTEG